MISLSKLYFSCIQFQHVQFKYINHYSMHKPIKVYN